MSLIERLRDLNERFRCEHTGGETAPFLREAAEEIDRLAAENVDLRHALGRTRNVLNNMAMEHATGWRSIFARWPIHHEPLRSDARGLLPVIDAALAGPQKASRQWICNGDPEQPSPGAPGQPIATAPVNEEVFVDRFDGLYIGMLDDDELATFGDLCRRGLLRRSYAHPGGLLGLARIERVPAPETSPLTPEHQP